MGFWDALFWMALIVNCLAKFGNIKKIVNANRAQGKMVNEDNITGAILFNTFVLLCIRWVIGCFLANWFAQLLMIFACFADLGATPGIQ